MDVAFFRRRGLGKPRAVGLLLARRSPPALSYRRDGRKRAVGRAGGRWQAAAGIGGTRLLGAQARIAPEPALGPRLARNRRVGPAHALRNGALRQQKSSSKFDAPKARSSP